MGLPPTGLHLCCSFLLFLYMNLSSAHRASLISISNQQAPSPAPSSGAGQTCCSTDASGNCGPCSRVGQGKCCKFLDFCYTCARNSPPALLSDLIKEKIRTFSNPLGFDCNNNGQGCGAVNSEQNRDEPDSDYFQGNVKGANVPMGSIGISLHQGHDNIVSEPPGSVKSNSDIIQRNVKGNNIPIGSDGTSHLQGNGSTVSEPPDADSLVPSLDTIQGSIRGASKAMESDGTLDWYDWLVNKPDPDSDKKLRQQGHVGMFREPAGEESSSAEESKTERSG